MFILCPKVTHHNQQHQKQNETEKEKGTVTNTVQWMYRQKRKERKTEMWRKIHVHLITNSSPGPEKVNIDLTRQHIEMSKMDSIYHFDLCKS